MIIVSISFGSLLAYNQSAFVNEQIKCRCILFGCIGIRLETQFVARKSEIPNQWTEEDACPMIRAGISFDPAYTWKTCNCKQRPDYYLSDRTDKRETGRIEICFLTHKHCFPFDMFQIAAIVRVWWACLWQKAKKTLCSARASTFDYQSFSVYYKSKFTLISNFLVV